LSSIVKNLKSIVNLTKLKNIDTLGTLLSSGISFIEDNRGLLSQMNIYSNNLIILYYLEGHRLSMREINAYNNLKPLYNLLSNLYKIYIDYMNKYKNMVIIQNTYRNKISNFMELIDSISVINEVYNDANYKTIIKPHLLKINRMLLYLINFIDNKSINKSNINLLHYLKDIIDSIKKFDDYKLFNFVITHFVNNEALKIFTTYYKKILKSSKSSKTSKLFKSSKTSKTSKFNKKINSI
jgi:hypothetical protein